MIASRYFARPFVSSSPNAMSAASLYTRPDGRKMSVNDIVDTYKRSFRFPTVSEATINRLQETGWSVKVKSSVRNTDLMEMDSHSQSFMILKGSSGLKVQQVSSNVSNPAVLAEDEKAGSRVFLKTESKDQDKSTFSITWYENGLLEKSIKLLDFDVHGPVVMKQPFATFTLSRDGSQVIYLAEKKKPKAKSFFEKDRKPSAQGDKTASSSPLGTEYEYKQSWGECLAEVYSPVICILDLKEEKIEVIEKDNHSLLCPFWIGNKNDEIGYLAVNEHPKKLGITYCVNRQSSLWKYSLADKQSSPLVGQAENSCLRSPRINPAGNQVIFLRNPVAGAHYRASEIVLLDLNSGETKILCDLNLSLYIESLPESCWHSDGSKVFFISQYRATLTLWQLEVNNGCLTKIESPLPSVSFLTVDHGLALIAATSLNHVPQLFACELDVSTSLSAPQPTWVPVTDAIRIDNISQQSVDVSENVQAFLLSPVDSAKKSAACILAIHGGPHTAYCDSFIAGLAFFISLGFKVLIINYRGSTGMTETDLNSLPGNIGTNDVADCIQGTRYFIDQRLIAADELFLWGGSHGGFLVCHLAGQFPDFNWVALATRNPVVDVAWMAQVTDIPDWCWFETFGDDRYSTHVTSEETTAKMYSVSPFKHVSRVKTPSLVLLGSQDLRVPMHAGIRWHEQLKKIGVPTKCFIYPDNHGLAKVPVDSDCMVQAALWYMQHLERKRSANL